jgi:multiple sugar transport system permease protein/raffinose/stachyose/melibiose transport system permease protein
MATIITKSEKSLLPERIRRYLAGVGAETPWSVVAVFLLPALVIYAAFTAYPVFRTFYNSLHIIQPRGAHQYIGFANYVKLLTSDHVFLTAVKNTMLWATAAPLLDVGIGLLLALFLYAKVPFARLFRVAWFTPVLISYVVVAIMWMWIYNYDWGAVNILLRAIGLDSWTQAWLGTPDTALAAIIITHSWKWAGFNMVVCLAALHSLPSEVLEAAELDNCGWLRKLVFVIIPMIRPTLLNLIILSFIGKMKVFDLVWIMTRGGPLWSTETVSTYVYKRAFEWSTFDLGYPSAIAVVWFVVIVVFVLLLSRLFRQRDKLEY